MHVHYMQIQVKSCFECCNIFMLDTVYITPNSLAQILYFLYKSTTQSCCFHGLPYYPPWPYIQARAYMHFPKPTFNQYNITSWFLRIFSYVWSNARMCRQPTLASISVFGFAWCKDILTWGWVVFVNNQQFWLTLISIFVFFHSFQVVPIVLKFTLFWQVTSAYHFPFCVFLHIDKGGYWNALANQ